VTGIAALVVDYGGVLTSPLNDSMQSWCDTDEIDPADFRAVMRDWLGGPYGEEAATNPAHALERGEIAVPDFERRLAERLRTRSGRPLQPEGLLARMFAGFREERPMVDVVRRVHAAGLRTGLLSNSWGNDYDRREWDAMFDAVVISGEVGMRKPEPRIYQLMTDRLGVAAHECVFVDDLGPNVKAAVQVGMVGVQHVTAEQTIGELEALLGLELRAGAA
jgi:epoxide hydrolase-like predicted phosphatase